jgi:hypothetical protein
MSLFAFLFRKKNTGSSSPVLADREHFRKKTFFATTGREIFFLWLNFLTTVNM